MKSFVRRNALVICSLVVAVGLVAFAVVYPSAAGDEPQRESVAPRGSLSDYAWDELSRISDEIGRCENERDAIACAHRYGLCGADGALSLGQTKGIQLANGETLSAVLVGVWHDERSDGGKAGLTFAVLQPVGEHAMNHAFERASGDDADSVGGWGASDMRAWLNGEFLYELPADLRSRIVSVQKKSVSSVDSRDELPQAGRLAGSGADWTVETSDKLWLFSASELCGSIPTNRALDVDSTIAEVYAAEGAQYRLFADEGVAAFAPNESLVVHAPRREASSESLPTEKSPSQQAPSDNPSADESRSSDERSTWWLRTKTLEFGDGFWLVGTDGAPLNGLGEDARAAKDPTFAPDELWGPDHARAVVPGFCL